MLILWMSWICSAGTRSNVQIRSMHAQRTSLIRVDGSCQLMGCGPAKVAIKVLRWVEAYEREKRDHLPSVACSGSARGYFPLTSTIFSRKYPFADSFPIHTVCGAIPYGCSAFASVCPVSAFPSRSSFHSRSPSSFNCAASVRLNIRSAPLLANIINRSDNNAAAARLFSRLPAYMHRRLSALAITCVRPRVSAISGVDQVATS